MTTILAMTLAWAAAQGQGIAAPEETDYPRYTVEVIIFEYAEEVSVGTERFLPEKPSLRDPDAPVEGDLVFEDTDAGAVEEESLPETDGSDFVLHAEDEFTMTDIARKLERLDVYRPVLHFSWTQATRPEAETQPIDLHSLAEPPQGLEGSFTLYLSRYLHLVVDLALKQRPGLADPFAIDDPVSEFRDGRGGASYEEVRPAPVRFRIFEDRIFKSGDLRYFDHPKFGVLAKITRVDEPDDEEAGTGLVGQLRQ